MSKRKQKAKTQAKVLETIDSEVRLADDFVSKPHDYTTGPIIKPLVMLSVPIIIINILQTLFQITDAFWVGRLGAEAVAAISISFPILFLATSIGFGLTLAGTIIVAQYKGKKDQKGINHVATQLILLVIAFSFFTGIIGFLLSEPLLTLMGADKSIIGGATAYLQISFLGLGFVFAYIAFQSIMRGVGSVNMPLLITLGAVILNVFLDPLLIFGFGPVPQMGVAGAAIATIISQALCAAIALIILLRGKSGIQIKLIGLIKPDFVLMKKIIFIGVPSSIEFVSRSLSMLAFTFVVASFGTIAVASFGLGIRIFSFILMPALGLSMATSTLVGQNIGAQKMHRVNDTIKKAMIISFASLMLVGALMFVFADPVTRFFVPNDEALITETAFFVRLLALSFGIIGVQTVILGAIRGSGATKIAMNLSIIFTIISLAGAYVLAYFTPLGLSGIWWSYPITNILTLIIAYIFLKKSNWAKVRVI
ncbi:MAG: MATE family efflux transporter [archaeon]